ncbi:hypothetical protein [Listeria goaensis]|uniref:hypothetical protein n=1 Tax=Listeria goaensis TaxID=1649188 RepID=UPI000B593C37|nr:hypothetical protein [Listeria goaensis]
MSEKIYKTTEAQREASKRWREKNKEKDSLAGSKRSALSFIRNKSTLSDLEQFESAIKERKKDLENP